MTSTMAPSISNGWNADCSSESACVSALSLGIVIPRQF